MQSPTEEGPPVVPAEVEETVTRFVESFRDFLVQHVRLARSGARRGETGDDRRRGRCDSISASAMSANPHLDRLRDEIAHGHALAIIGAGLSIGATGNAQAASWTGLLEDGVDRCQALGQSTGWAGRVRDEIRSGDMDDLLSAAGLAPLPDADLAPLRAA